MTPVDTVTVPTDQTGDGPAAALGIVPAERNASRLATSLAVAGRTVRKFLRTPQLVVVGTIQGAMFLLIFRYVFGGAIQTSGAGYVDFFVPGFLVTGVVFSGAGAAAGVAEDVEQGLFDRLRSLPVSRMALLGGRALADTALLAYGAMITTAIGFLVGFRLAGSTLEGVGALALVVLFGFAFSWLFILMGLAAGNAQAAQSMSIMVFPLTFISAAYVPVDSMPGWMQPFADHQPITAMVNATRSLALGGPDAAGVGHTTAYWVTLSLLWSAGLVLAFAPLAVRRYRRS